MDRDVLAVLPTGYGKVSISKLLRDGDLFQPISVQWSHAGHEPLATLKLCSCSLSCDQRNGPILKQQPHRRQMSLTEEEDFFYARFFSLALLSLRKKENFPRKFDTTKVSGCHRTVNVAVELHISGDIGLQSNLRLRPPLISDHLSSATSFPKHQKFLSQITIFGTSCKRPRPLLELKV